MSEEKVYSLFAGGNLKVRFKNQGWIALEALIEIDDPNYPDDWFDICNVKSLASFDKKMQSSKLSTEDKYMLPEWLMYECYFFHWRSLKYLLKITSPS